MAKRLRDPERAAEGAVWKVIDSPVGPLKLVASGQALIAVLWGDDDPQRVRLGDLTEDNAHPVLVQTERQLAEYFAGERTTFSITLEMRGTPFQKEVWHALLAIPFGETRSYGEVARQLRKPSASRAVGAANGRNSLSILVPCHRVIGASGKLTGFAGGLGMKARLLQMEKAATPSETEPRKPQSSALNPSRGAICESQNTPWPGSA